MFKKYVSKAGTPTTFTAEQVANAPVNDDLMTIALNGFAEDKRIFHDSTAAFKDLGAIEYIRIEKRFDENTLKHSNKVAIKFKGRNTENWLFNLYGIKDNNGKIATLATQTIKDNAQLAKIRLGYCTKGEKGEKVRDITSDGSLSADVRLYVDISALALV